MHGSILNKFYFHFQGHTELMLCVFVGCHLLGMSSACLNPILYGYLNESFRQEFSQIFNGFGRSVLAVRDAVCKLCKWKKPGQEEQRPRSSSHETFQNRGSKVSRKGSAVGTPNPKVVDDELTPLEGGRNGRKDSAVGDDIYI